MEAKAAPGPAYPNCGPGVIPNLDNAIACCNASIYTTHQEPVSMCGDITIGDLLDGGKVYSRCDCTDGDVCHSANGAIQCGPP